jgi:methionyl-tRNA formyltransferase
VTDRARTVFFGSGPFGVESLRRLAGEELSRLVELVGVVTAPPRAAGRGGQLRVTPIEQAAAELGLGPLLRPESLRATDGVADVLALEPDLALLADYGQIVPPALLELRHAALNLHPSLLPRHRGASPIAATILAGDARTGVTLMQMDAGLDSGPIVAQVGVELNGKETAPELEARLAALAAQLLADNLGPWLRGAIEPRPQVAEGMTMTRPLRRADGRLDPTLPAVQLERQVRAYQPWPGSFLETAADRLVVWRAAVLPADRTAEPGRLVATDASPAGLALVTSDGLLELVEVQPSGGRRMSAAELLRGRRALVGSTVNEARTATKRG